MASGRTPKAATTTTTILLEREMEPAVPGGPNRLHLQRAALQYARLDISVKRTIGSHTAHTGCTWLELAPSDPRFLLVARTDRSLSIYDLDDQVEQFNNMRSIRRVAVIAGDLAHEARVTAVQWFPFDTGLFTSSSTDCNLKVWDTASLKAAFVFRLEDQIHTHALSPVATTHALIAAATDASLIRLCDLKSGAPTHSLKGHKGATASLQWSPAHEFLLASGGADGTIRFWDIRKANACIWTTNHSSARVAAHMSHYGSSKVNGLAFTSDGLSLASIGHDQRLQLWSVMSGDNRQVPYAPHFVNRGDATLRLGVTRLGDTARPLLACPSDGGAVLLYELWTGNLAKRLKAHLGRVGCAAFRPVAAASDVQLVTGGVDDPVLLWEPREAAGGGGGPSGLSGPSGPSGSDDADRWSDDGDD
ncbi:WD40-repeat-containing domain protein [Entophlyctis helioformis]|nr:WD40-repeat-containing domain protein [Entophlyctis helioformis]